jgi:hypothetical protein
LGSAHWSLGFRKKFRLKGMCSMEAYEFYLCDPIKGSELIGVLPERRKNPERITKKSVMGWVVRVFGDKLSTKDIYFIQVTINEYTGKIFRATHAFVRQK